MSKTKEEVINKPKHQLEIINSDQSVYEVIRIIGGIALFLEDHFSRFQQSMKILGISFEMDFQNFKRNIIDHVVKEKTLNGNIMFKYSLSESENNFTFSVVPHSYPGAKDYLNGVKTDLFHAERKNPNAKVIQTIFRDGANQAIAHQKLFEVLLVDGDGLITEGSRSNVFFVKDNVFYTAPATKVLVGITRKKVMECLTELEFIVVEEAVSHSEISRYDAVFLTGTSPGILPVRSIGNQIFNTSHPMVIKLMEQYNNLIKKYMQIEKKII